MKTYWMRALIGACIGLVIAAGIVWWQVSHLPPAPTATGVAGADVGGPFTLVDHTGRTVTDQDFGGRYLLVYFGFTYCPDVCPTELQTMTQAIDLLGPDADRVQPLFITVDPQRDTADVLADYVRLFHPRLVGLTGTPEQIAEAARAYRVYYAKAPGDDPTHYLMDHSSFVYLMDPQGDLAALFTPGTDAEEMARTLRNHLKA